MRLKVERFKFLDKCTIGRFYEDDCPFGFTLEPAVRDHKIPGITAIPLGSYVVKIDFSEHFQRDLPHVMNVPNFEGVRIHPGNTDKDTQGCILMGQTWDGGDFIGHSKALFDAVFQAIQKEIAEGQPVTLEIVNEVHSP